MNVITIPRKSVSDDLVIIPRKEYEALKARPAITEFTPTQTQLRALARARKNLKEGKTISYDDLQRSVATRHR